MHQELQSKNRQSRRPEHLGQAGRPFVHVNGAHFSSDPKMNSGCNYNMGQRWSAINEARMPVTDGTMSTTDCWTMRFSTSKGRGIERCQAPVMDHMLHPKPLNRGPVMHIDTHVGGMARWPLEGIAERCVPQPGDPPAHSVWFRQIKDIRFITARLPPCVVRPRQLMTAPAPPPVSRRDLPKPPAAFNRTLQGRSPSNCRFSPTACSCIECSNIEMAARACLISILSGAC